MRPLETIRPMLAAGAGATVVLAIAVLANLGDWLRAAIPDWLRATFVLASPPDWLRANVPNVHGHTGAHAKAARWPRNRQCQHPHQLPRRKVGARASLNRPNQCQSWWRIRVAIHHAAEAGGRNPICIQQSTERPSARERSAQQTRACVAESARSGQPRERGLTSRIHFVTAQSTVARAQARLRSWWA